jgi:hypothetical protein
MFRPEGEKANAAIRGDISPWYARLSRQSVEAVHRLLPEARLILVIRNPIDRVWSNVLMELAQHGRRPLAEVRIGQFIRHCDRLRQVRLGDYERMIDDWTAYYRGNELLVETYDRVSSDPNGLLRGLLTHIGADPDWTPPADQVNKRHWSVGEATGGQSDALAMPELLRWYLAMNWREPVRRLNQRINGRVENWVREMEELTGRRVSVSWRMQRLAHRLLLIWPQRLAFVAYNAMREFRLRGAYARLHHEYEQKYGAPSHTTAEAHAAGAVRFSHKSPSPLTPR